MACFSSLLIGQYRRSTKNKILCDARNEFSALKQRYSVLRKYESSSAMLKAMARLTIHHPSSLSIMGCLLVETQRSRPITMAADILLWAMFPFVGGAFTLHRCSPDNSDLLHASLAGLLEAIVTFPVGKVDDSSILPALRMGIRRGLRRGLKEQRATVIATRIYRERIKPLGPEGLAGRRQYYVPKIRFEAHERADARECLAVLLGGKLIADPRIEVWSAMVIDGESVAQYVRRQMVINNDEEQKKAESQCRSKKYRINCLIKVDLRNNMPAAANDDIAAEFEQEVQRQMPAIWGGYGRQEPPDNV